MSEYERIDSFGTSHKKILLVEDNLGDIEIIKEKFSEDTLPHSLFLVNNGQQALEFLHGNEELPDMVIMDINMPIMNGHEALAAIRKDQKLKSLPVVMLSSSDTSRDIDKSCELGANGYFVKPNYCSLKELIPIIEMLRLSPSIFVKID